MRSDHTLRGIVLFLLLGGILPIVSGCVDEPSPVGSALLPPSDLVNVDSLTLVSHESYSTKAIPQSFFAGPATAFALGKSGSLEAWALIQPPQFHDSLKLASAQSAELRLRVSHHLGDSLGAFSLAVRRPTQSWNRSSFTYDSLTFPGFLVPTATPPQNFGPIGDTAEIRIMLDTALVNEWLIAGSSTPHYGFALEPTNATVIKLFHNSQADSIAYIPELTILYTDSGSQTVDTLRTTFLAQKFVAGATDTTFFSENATVYARNGAAYRGVVGFDISQVPVKASIHKAILEVTLNTASSDLSSRARDSLVAHYVLSDGNFQEFAFGLTGWVRNPVLLSEPATVSGQRVYRFNVTEFVQFWVRGYGQHRIGVAGFGEANSVDGYALYGSGATDPSVRPHLIILYSPTQ